MKKGFTLIELLAVMVILAIISLIVTISVSSIINSSKNSLSKTQINNIESSAQAYYLKEGMNINDNCVSVSDLILKGYLEGNSVKDPKNNKEITGYVKITNNANQYLYEYQPNSCE